MNVAVVGATGMVGQVILKVLEERAFPITTLIPVASEKSVGKEIHFLPWIKCVPKNATNPDVDFPLRTSLDMSPGFSFQGEISIQRIFWDCIFNSCWDIWEIF